MNMKTTSVMVALVAAACLAAAAASSGCSSSPDFQFFVFTQQWGASNGCSDCGPSSPWTIHGMWPSNRGSTQPCYCGATFNIDEIESILPLMQKAWPSYQGSDSSFWSHEYEKHGSCATESPYMTSEFDFFNNTVTVYLDMDFTQALAQAGIRPTGSQYSSNAISSAISDAFGYAPRLSCSNGQISAISVCLDRSLQIGPCPEASSGGDDECSSYVTYPAYSESQSDDYSA